jgi:pimeloyl-ACP methyl ester carboxylesterase
VRWRGRPRTLRTLIVVVLAGALAVVGWGAFDTGPAPRSSPSPAPTVGGSSGTSAVPSTTAVGPSPPYAVVTSTVPLIDPSRGTPARGSVPAQSGRLLTTEIWRPVGVRGPLPLIVFAHGWNSDPGVYGPLLQAWAAAGYLVAAPVFPDSADTLPGTPVSDFPDQARDLSFVLTSLLGGGALPIDPTRIAAAGHSDGGSDVALLALNPAYADHRIRAYLSLSSEMPAALGGPWDAPTPGTLLVAVGTLDQYGLFPRATQVYQTANMTKALLTVAGGDHLGPFVGTSVQSQSVRVETVRFLQLALAPRTITPGDLGAALTPPGDPSITVTTGSG